MARDKRGFDTFEHTADVGLEVWAEDMPGLFKEAARGFISLLADPTGVRKEREVEVTAGAEEADEMLVSWLEEILYIVDVEGLVLCDVRVDEMNEGEIKGTVRGEPLDRQRHELRNDIKAVTYHDLRIEETESGLRTRIVFDV